MLGSPGQEHAPALQLLWLAPALPLLGAFALALCGGLLPRRWVATIGCASVGLSWAVSLAVGVAYMGGSHQAFRQGLYQWISADGLQVSLGLHLDALSLVMLEVVTFVGFFIHLYSVQFMEREDGYGRFFCYLNLFVASMLVLVLGDNFASLYLGWEGVGLCSYLLIGFWYRDPANGRAAQKAFIVTRVGDTALAIGIFLIFARLGTLDIQGAMGGVGRLGEPVALAAALLVLGGAVGKSAQLPLQTWLPEAMAGPTPVSALIHAATMVTAGVYLIARTHLLFAASPPALLAVAVVGASSAVYAAVSALAQYDIKRVLAYSTISQIGYMFLALGVGAWGAAIFHFVTHAFIKSLLFLSAGVVIQALGEEHDIRRMGGLWRRLPIAGWTFLIGACSLSALPLVTAGFYSKDAIIWAAWSSPLGSPALWAAAIAASLLTAVYIFRVFFLVFLGSQSSAPERMPGGLTRSTVVVLSVFAIIAGGLWLPTWLGGFAPIGRLMAGLFGPAPGAGAPHEAAFVGVSAAVSVVGIALAYLFFVRLQVSASAWQPSRPYLAARRFFLMGWRFDWLYERAFVWPYVKLTSLNRNDAVDYMYLGLAAATAWASRLLATTQSGRVRSYATGILLGAVLVAVVVLSR
ncbi:MAG: NADH-quinone oxidoreductase subunit L [Armatimonadota bacterium]